MLIKNILIGVLVSLFCLGLAGTVIAGDNEKPNTSLGDKVSPMNTDNDTIEFDYSPRESSSLASVTWSIYGRLKNITYWRSAPEFNVEELDQT